MNKSQSRSIRPSAGDILSVTTSYGSTRVVQLAPSPGGGLALYGADGEDLAEDLPGYATEEDAARAESQGRKVVRDWRYGTPEEHQDFARYRQTLALVEVAEAHGAPSVARAVEGVTDRDDVLCDVVWELRERGRDGLASQVAAFRFEVAS